MITEFTEKELNDMCQEVLDVFKRYGAREEEAIAACFLIITSFYRFRLTKEPRKREALAELIETQFQHLNQDVLGER